jgi:CRP-like cAMP-binding protein
MEQLKQVMQQMIEISDTEIDMFLDKCLSKNFTKGEVLSRPGIIPNEIFFINSGLVRVIVSDNDAVEHTIHFALENQFIADYSAFIRKLPATYTLVAQEEVEAIVLPRQAVEWGYQNLQQGDRLGHLIAEFYFIYQDERINNIYSRTPKERYDNIVDVFPNIHNRVPQHMIASYLGITPVHLSRLKNEASRKI